MHFSSQSYVPSCILDLVFSPDRSAPEPCFCACANRHHPERLPRGKPKATLRKIQFVRGVFIASLCLAFSGCSLFGPWKQTLTISSDPPDASVVMNGDFVGTTPLKHRVHRWDKLLIEIRKEGYKTHFIWSPSHPSPSTLGILDMVGGCIILLPFVGLLSPAAWEHNPAVFGVTLDPVEAVSK